MDSVLEIADTVHTNRYLPLKRILDLCLGTFSILLFGPLMLILALGIRLSSPGPIYYRQKRIGKDGVPFEMLKFRSMQVQNMPDLHREHVQGLIRNNTHHKELGGKSLKMGVDPRITGMGKYLRKLSLDELPQFFNVMKGQMSIVGPRPPLPYEYEIYGEWHKGRLAVLPGITGLWQVTSHNTVSFDEMVRIDLGYIKSMNLWLDLKIILMTPIEMIRGKGAG
jgi:lipopolysaccharide/colanic/teichoic acid biosynthesis glycosyltransferase